MTKSRPISDDDLYRNSSQYRQWSFTRPGLTSKLEALHVRASDAIQQKLDQEGISDVELLSLEEHNKLVRFYASKIEDIAKVFHMPSQVRVTAAAHFRRFYLENSVMEYHPKNILYTTVYLASKAENFFIPIDKFCAALPRTDRQQVLDIEFLVLQSLKFTLSVFSPFKSLHGFYLDLQATLPDIGLDKLGKVHDQARSFISQSLITDAQFLYTPPQIALAAMFNVDSATTTLYLSSKLIGEGSAMSIDHLLAIIKSCLKEMQQLDLPSSDVGKQIDKKLHLCLNPRKKKRSSPPTEPDIDSSVKKLKSEAA